MTRRSFIFWGILFIFTLFRLWYSFDINVPSINDCLSNDVTGIGKIVKEPERRENSQILIVDVDKIFRLSGEACATDIKIKIKAKLYPEFNFSNRISFSGKISKPFNFMGDTGRIFDYEGYLAKDDIFYEIKSATVEKLIADITKQNKLSFFVDVVSLKLFSVKKYFTNVLRTALGEPHASLASGLVVGEKSSLGKELINDFRVVGLIHIVVLSGYNITIIGDLIRRIFIYLPRVWGIILSGISISIFGVLVGGGATVIRSCFMANTALFADFVRRDYKAFQALLFAGILMIMINPRILLHDPSFQLSFLATLGLIILASPIEKRLIFIPEKFGIRGIVASTIATQIFVSPYLLYMMGQISLVGMIVNILVLPFIPVTMLLVFITGMVGMLSINLVQPVAFLAHLLLSYELLLVRNFSQLEFASISVPSFPIWWVGIFYMIFFIIYLYFIYRSDQNSSQPHSSLS